MPVTLAEDTRLDLELSEEASVDWEKLAAGVQEMGGAYMWCNPCGVDCSGGVCSCGGC
jgi:hypothetical protein